VDSFTPSTNDKVYWGKSHWAGNRKQFRCIKEQSARHRWAVWGHKEGWGLSLISPSVAWCAQGQPEQMICKWRNSSSLAWSLSSILP
jgi:hypothetical protein